MEIIFYLFLKNSSLVRTSLNYDFFPLHNRSDPVKQCQLIGQGLWHLINDRNRLSCFFVIINTIYIIWDQDVNVHITTATTDVKAEELSKIVFN